MDDPSSVDVTNILNDIRAEIAERCNALAEKYDGKTACAALPFIACFMIAECMEQLGLSEAAVLQQIRFQRELLRGEAGTGVQS